jgi:two-component system, chemotaxis family, chemotaxis protein CheY
MSGYRLDKLKLLVADDNEHMRKLIGTILCAFGAPQIMEADSGEAAWKMLLNHTVDMIIVDWQMGAMSGLDFVRKVRTDPESPNPFVPIIMLTGHANIDHVRMARDSGANEFLAKPVSVKTLLARLIAIIENPRPFVRTKSYFGPCRRRRNDTAYHGPERRSDASASDLSEAAAVRDDA